MERLRSVGNILHGSGLLWLRQPGLPAYIPHKQEGRLTAARLGGLAGQSALAASKQLDQLPSASPHSAGTC